LTARPITMDRPFTIVLDDDRLVEGLLRRIDAGPTWAKHRVSIALDQSDTRGHMFDPTGLAIDLRFDDDRDTHPLNLSFPTPRSADEFRLQLLATGTIDGSLVVGVTAAQWSRTIDDGHAPS